MSDTTSTQDPTAGDRRCPFATLSEPSSPEPAPEAIARVYRQERSAEPQVDDAHRQRSQHADSEHSELQEGEEEEDEQGDDAEHCICAGPEEGWMIGCEGGCEAWFHGDCVNIEEKDEELLERFVCPSCTTDIRKTVWKKSTSAREAALAYEEVLRKWQKAHSPKKHTLPRIRIEKTGTSTLAQKKKPGKSPTQAMTRATQLGLRERQQPATMAAMYSPMRFDDEQEMDFDYIDEEEKKGSSSESEAAEVEKSLFVHSSEESSSEDEESMHVGLDKRGVHSTHERLLKMSVNGHETLMEDGKDEDDGDDEDDDDLDDMDMDKLMGRSRVGPEKIEQTFAYGVVKQEMEKALSGRKA